MAEPTTNTTTKTNSTPAAKKGKAAAAAAAPASVPAQAPAPSHRRSGKPTVWRKLAGALERAETARKRALAVVEVVRVTPGLKISNTAIPALSEAAKALASGGWDKAVPALQVLDSERVQAPRPPKAAKFATGAEVRVVKKEVARYTKSGLYTAEFLATLVVDKVSPNGREYICRDPDGAESIHVRYAKHLEAR